MQAVIYSSTVVLSAQCKLVVKLSGEKHFLSLTRWMSGFKGLMLFSDGKCVKSVKECFWYLRPNQSLRLSSHQHKQPLCLHPCITPPSSNIRQSRCLWFTSTCSEKVSLRVWAVLAPCFGCFGPRFIHLLQTDLEPETCAGLPKSTSGSSC